jgi:RNA polymerase-binding transcription factor DksA
MLDKEFIDKMKMRILEEKKRVDAKIAELTAPETGQATQNWDDTATDAIEDVEQESLLKIYRGTQERVNKALKKIEEGTFGQCSECQVEVPIKALEFEPWAEFCQALCSKKNEENS